MASTEANGRATTDIDAEETRDWLESLDSVLRNDGADRARFLLERLVAQAGRVGASPPLGGTTPYINTIPVDQEPRLPGRRGDRAAHPHADPLERDGDGARGQQGVLRARRPHRELPVGGDAVRGRLQPLLARAVGGPRRRPRVHAGPLRARLLRARVPRGPPERGPAAPLPAGDRRERRLRRRRHLLLSAPVADARLLAVPDGVDGARPDHGDLPGALHEVPPRSRDRRHRRAARSGASSATARPTSRSRWARSRWRAARSSTT